MTPPTRIVMLGTGDFALPTFAHLLETGHDVIALVTQPDRPQGRKQELIPSRIKQMAQARAIRIEQPADVNAAESLHRLRELSPDLLVTAAYGQILSTEALAIPKKGAINLHGSILPAYRGAAPVARAIQNGEVETGVTVIRMTSRIDAGGMISVARTAIGPDETAGELEKRLAHLGAPLVEAAVAALNRGESVMVTPQDRSRVTKAPKLVKEDGLIEWSRPALSVHNLVRAMQPWPTAYTFWRPAEGTTTLPQRLVVHRTQVATGTGAPGEVLEASADHLIIACGAGAVAVRQIQLPGKRRLSAAEFMRGHRIERGTVLGGDPP
jgi:methionyl-tRNA formyltransferase